MTDGTTPGAPPDEVAAAAPDELGPAAPGPSVAPSCRRGLGRAIARL